MRRAVEGGRTLLVDGPASIGLLEGAVRILGAPVREGERLVVREGKRLPLEVGARAEFDLTLGEGASVEEVEGSTTPPSWEAASGKIVSLGGPVAVAVLGGTDSGKSSFCVYLGNRALERGRRVAVIDADLGQSDIGPPSTIGYSRLTRPTRDLFDLGAERAVFVGVTSPSWAVGRVLEGLTRLRGAVTEGEADILIVNTDGWIGGEDAVAYKVRLVERIAPGVVVGIQREGELEPVLAALKGARALRVDPPPTILGRSRERRKTLRELSYRKHLKGAKAQSFSLARVRVEGGPLGTGRPPTAEQKEKIRDLLGADPVHCEVTPSVVLFVLEKDRRLDEAQLVALEGALGRRVMTVSRGEEEGLIVGLEDREGALLGIGVLCGFDYRSGAVRVHTPVREEVSLIRIGQMRLDRDGREIGMGNLFLTDPLPPVNGA